MNIGTFILPKKSLSASEKGISASRIVHKIKRPAHVCNPKTWHSLGTRSAFAKMYNKKMSHSIKKFLSDKS